LPGSGPPLIYSVTGKALGPGSGAAFIFVGAFTGDTSGDVVAFATTGTRWGPVTYSGGTSMPIGTCTPQGFALAQHRGEDFEGNGLVTVDAVTVGAYPEIDHWSWTGSEFALRTSDAFSSGVVRSVPAKPTVGSPCQPPQENLRRGVYDVYLQGEWGEGQLGATQVKALVGPRPGDWQCYIEIPIAAPLLLPASTHPGGTARAWISEPAWLLSHGGTPDGPELDGLSVPAGYRVTAGAGQPLASAGLGLGPPQPVHARISYADDVTPTIYVLPSQ
ncbi:MAG TPA: hypothetical protein VFN61_12680, partial [Acidimicrobiales bacterium]|nr:hypothetical protein [Acidimicrobiales bacterium]